MLPPTLGAAGRDPACEVEISSEPMRLARPHVLVNSFASGGTNYSVVARATS